jgi:[protein-PII] uridylyltransferase
MARHRELVLAHAEEQLVSQGKQDPAELLALYKKFLKIENHRLQLKHYAGGGGREVAQQRAELVDVVLRHLFDTACKCKDVDGVTALALVATGGYGRGELNPFSDVDIMFLHDAALRTIPREINEAIQLILYMLWDVGFKVGHSTRSIPGAIKHANSDTLSKTALLESRFLTGEKGLFEKFKDEFEERCVRGYEESYIEDRVRNQTERHAKHGGTVYMQEPNIKNGCGGLRDYQNMLWIAYFKQGISDTAGLVDRKLLSEGERRRLDRAYDFLMRVRTELHYLNKRPLDALAMNFQFQIAEKWKYPQKNPLRRSEAFMRDYYMHARHIYHLTNVLAHRLAVTPGTRPARGALFKFLSPAKIKQYVSPRKEDHFDGFFSREGELYHESREIFKEDPFRLIRLFQHAQQRRLEISADLQQLIGRRLHLVDRTFQYSRAARETFYAILSRKGEVGRILRMMHEVDFLGRYIPEFGELTCLVQHEFFHRYTADEHTLVCIEKLDSLIDTEEAKFVEYRNVFQKLEDPFVLYLALLLHDTGKASNARQHAEASALFAQNVATRLQLSPERRKSLILLVDSHLVLSSTAQRRNLDDPATIAEFATVVRNQSNLDALMLLTLADGQGTGDVTWSDWKESLVWQLYKNTSQYLADGEAFYRQRKIEREDLRRAVAKKLAKDFAEEIEAHFQYMPEMYFQTHTPADIGAHVRMFRAFLDAHFENGDVALVPAIKWLAHPDRGHSEVWICTWDRNQLLAKIAGSLALAQLNILSADIYTRGDNLVLDIFRVCNTRFEAVADERDTAQVEKQLRQALGQEDYDFGPLLDRVMRRRGWHLSQELDFPTRITINNESHPVYTLVDIQTPDRLGLLYNLLRGFAEAGVSIALSRITTEKGAAIDSFYVTNFEGRQVRDPGAIERLQKGLQRAVERRG